MAPVKKPIPKRNATFLKVWRNYRGISQEAAAERVGVDRTTIGRLEKGLIPYNQDILEKISSVYECRVEDLLTVDPLKIDPARLVYRQLLQASPEMQRQALAVIEAMLKAEKAA